MTKKKRHAKPTHKRPRSKAVAKNTRRRVPKKATKTGGNKARKTKRVSKVPRKVQSTRRNKGRRGHKANALRTHARKIRSKKATRNRKPKRVKKVLGAPEIIYTVVARHEREDTDERKGPKSVTLRIDLPGGYKDSKAIFKGKELPLNKDGFYDIEIPPTVFLSIAYEYENKEYWRNKISEYDFLPSYSGRDSKRLTDWILERLETWRDQYDELIEDEEEEGGDSYKNAFNPDNWKYLLVKLIYS